MGSEMCIRDRGRRCYRVTHPLTSIETSTAEQRGSLSQYYCCGLRTWQVWRKTSSGVVAVRVAGVSLLEGQRSGALIDLARMENESASPARDAPSKT